MHENCFLNFTISHHLSIEHAAQSALEAQKIQLENERDLHVDLAKKHEAEANKASEQLAGLRPYTGVHGASTTEVIQK